MRLRKPSWWAVLLTVLGVVLFVRLGFWQLDRATEKEQLLARFSHANEQPVKAFSQVADRIDPDSYPHVQVRGHLEADHRYILDNQTRHGRAGVVVFVPMKVCADADTCRSYRSRTLLVALGFLRRENGSRVLPRLPPIRDSEVTLTGLYAPPPGRGLELGGNALAREDAWPKLTTYIDLKQIAHDLNVPVDSRVLLLDQDPASAYIRSWTPATMPPTRHRAYAFQWFSFALAAIVIFLVLHRQTPTTDDDDDHETP
ncbi:MAG: SURF1 family protein [Rhodanobacteraceae bacterium]